MANVEKPLVSLIGPSNHFAVLSSPNIEEGEVQQLDGNEMDYVETSPSHSTPLRDGDPPLPVEDSSPPSYADIARKKPVKSSDSSD